MDRDRLRKPGDSVPRHTSSRKEPLGANFGAVNVRLSGTFRRSAPHFACCGQAPREVWRGCRPERRQRHGRRSGPLGGRRSIGRRQSSCLKTHRVRRPHPGRQPRSVRQVTNSRRPTDRLPANGRLGGGSLSVVCPFPIAGAPVPCAPPGPPVDRAGRRVEKRTEFAGPPRAPTEVCPPSDQLPPANGQTSGQPGGGRPAAGGRRPPAEVCPQLPVRVRVSGPLPARKGS
jgi:hypothetical protein